MKNKLLTLALITMLVFTMTACGDSAKIENAKSDTEESTESTDADEPTEEATEAPTSTTEAYETDLTAGIYTAGVDIPTGTYNLTAVSGNGNVSSSNMFTGGLNEVMGNPADEYSVDSFTGANLSEPGTTLSVGSTLVLHIQSDAADTSGITARATTSAAPVDLASGNFTAGTDFPAGTYNVVAVSGSGNVSSSNIFEGGLNEIMGTESDGMSISEFKNAQLPEGTTLTVSGVNIQLVPVGE